MSKIKLPSFRQYIVEGVPEKTHHASVIPLTGFSPISHMGHSKDLGEALKKLPGDKHLGVSSKADVYSPEERSQIIHRQWNQPDVQHHFVKSGGETIANAHKALPKDGKKVLHILVGHDRKDFAEGLKKSLEAGKIKEMGQERWDEIHIHHPEDSDRSHGMSGTNLRKAANEKNVAEFHKHLGPMFSRAEAIDHMKRIHKAIQDGKIKLKRESVEDNPYYQLISEGVHDHGTFKAVFLAGGPGSGKDYVLHNVLNKHGLVEIPADKAHNYLTDKDAPHNTEHKNDTDRVNHLRRKITNIGDLKHHLALSGRNGILINGSGDDLEKHKAIKKHLENMGYETSMVMVHSHDEASKQRNIERGQRGGRTMPEDLRKSKWDRVQAARPHYAQLFKKNYHEFDNSEDLRTAHPEIVKAKKDHLKDLGDKIHDFIHKPPTTEKSQEWVKKQLSKRDFGKVKSDPELAPHPDVKGGDEADKLGLTYYGQGKYGKNNKVTHKAVHGKLVDMEKFHDQLKKEKEAAKKKTVKEDINQLFTDFVKGELLDVEENSGISWLQAKEGNRNNRTGITEEGNQTSNTLHSEEKANIKGRITLAEIKARCEKKKASTKESIDKGIEPGLAMNSYAKEKIRKKDGKITMTEFNTKNKGDF